MTPHALGVMSQETTVEEVLLHEIPVSWYPQWDALAGKASEPNPFAERWFMQPAINHLDTARDDRLLAVWSRSSLIGLLPVTHRRRYGRLPVHHIENWLHYHCFYGAPLVRAGDEALFWTAVLARMDRASWASNFFHIVGLDPTGPVYAGLIATRRADVVYRTERAFLKSPLNPEAYYVANMRQKKRKELRRLRARLDDLGVITVDTLSSKSDAGQWITDFLLLEASGWKGRERTALNATPETSAFFTDVITGAQAERKLDMVRLAIDGRPIAMLVNFLTPPGSFSFKIAFDENFARFSPGVLIKIENLKILADPAIEWSDSCAVEDHPMINSLWAERRTIIRATVPLAGAARHLVFHAARSAEQLSSALKGW